jgi:hypothetical protein
MKTDFDEFKSYYVLADQLIDLMTKEQIADALRLVAFHLGGLSNQLRTGPEP